MRLGTGQPGATLVTCILRDGSPRTQADMWSRIENNKYYSINLTFGNETPWTAEAVAKFFPGTNNKALSFRTSQQQFFAELVGNNSLIISQNGSPISEFSLTGAKDA